MQNGMRPTYAVDPTQGVMELVELMSELGRVLALLTKMSARRTPPTAYGLLGRSGAEFEAQSRFSTNDMLLTLIKLLEQHITRMDESMRRYVTADGEADRIYRRPGLLSEYRGLA